MKETIQFWANELLTPAGNDLLVNVLVSKRFYHLKNSDIETIPVDKELKKILLETNKNKRNIGIDSLCKVQDIVIWEWKGKTRHTPLQLIPLSVKQNKINQTLKIKQANSSFFNPFLVKIFEDYIDFNASFKAVKEQLLASTLITEIKHIEGLANVHHHRFSIIKELELLADKGEEDSNLSHLLGFSASAAYNLALSDRTIFSSDTDQQKVYTCLKEQNTVVEGPPGTGKSQVIANILAKSCAFNSTTLLLAEKPAALQVVYDKLKTHNLHYLCSFYSGNKSNTANILSLERTYTFLENFSSITANTLYLSEQRLNALQQKMDKLNSPAIIGGVDFQTFKSIASSVDLNKNKFDVSAPDLKTWLHAKPHLEKIFNARSHSFAFTKIRHLQQYSLEQVNRLVEQLNHFLSKTHAVSVTPGSVEKSLKRIYYTQLFYFSGIELNTALLQKDSAMQKRFFKLHNAFFKQKAQLEILEKETINWKRNLSNSEISDFITALSTTDRFNLKSRRKRKALSKLSTTGISNFLEALENLKKLNLLKVKQIEVEDKLRKLNIEPLEADLIALKNIVERVNTSDENEIETLSKLTSSERKSILEKEKEVSALHQFLKQFSLEESKTVFEQLQEIKESIPTLILYFSEIKQLDTSVLTSLSKFKSIKDIEEVVCVSAYLKFESLHPSMRSFDGTKLKEDLEEVLHLQKDEFALFANSILREANQKFIKYHTLLNTPASKLSEENKALKIKLRKGKAILVKEFSKSRSHKSPLELNSSDAKIWIDLLHPIKLLSTYQLASDFPLEKESIDLAVFDEASQIPLANAFGGVYRAKRILVAGDTQQMSPSTFFKSHFDSIDLLHQAVFHFKKVKLTHHYRSTHPALIAFSNQHFYNNQLKTFQGYPIQYPIEFVKCTGIYTNHGNEREAEKVAQIIVNKLAAQKYDFGVVTFNEKQLKLIYSKLSAPQQIQLDALIEDGILFKSVENVQGDECDHLIISLGFAYTIDGKFDMRFGPINQEDGGKRLNVLLSRAKKQLTFVCSVNASDFKISDNNGVDLLRKFMLFAEQPKTNNPFFPNSLQVNRAEQELRITAPFSYFESSSALLTYYAVMQKRGWELTFEI